MNETVFLAHSRAVEKLQGLPSLLGGRVLSYRTQRSLGQSHCQVLAWGRKPSARKAETYAARHGLPVLRIEDGFLRSVGLGATEPPLSIVADGQGIYYDAGGPSDLERLIAAGCSAEEAARAQQLVALWREGRLSKYNHLREYAGELPERYVLVVDQTWGDASIRCGAADAGSFQRMLQAAIEENPDCRVLLKIHPDVQAGRKRGHFDLRRVARMPRVQVLAQEAHPVSLLERARAVYTVTSQMGFEGLLWGKRVRCFGMPFYAGWGLTQDELPAPARRGKATLEALAHAALVAYPRYLDPETGQRCEPERLMAWMALQRRMRTRFPAQVQAAGFSMWKRPIVRSFFAGSEVCFVRRMPPAPPPVPLVLWGRTPAPPGATVIRLEDGFLRSVGLGADLVRPLSWVMDRTGLYYDASRPSDLETLLQTASFDAALLARARALRERIVALGLTKYNVGAGDWRRPKGASRVVLVPGQVESDASISYGAAGLRTNLALLQATRQHAPDAHLLYKPHPDVVAGLRRSGQGEDQARRFCDEVVIDAPMHALLEAVDEVHVLTSLTGFEALLRGKKVVCHGHPFYAGWGLTQDRQPLPRRSRRLTLDELVAGVLILYPAYVSRTSGAFTTPERALDELLAWRAQTPSHLPVWQRLRRWLLTWRKH